MSLSAGDARVGDVRELLLTEDLSRTQLVQYAGVSGDYNPVHTDDRYAREVAGYSGVFAHGMLTMGMSARVLTDWFGDGHLVRYGVRFSRQVWPGDALTAVATIDAMRQVDGVSWADITVITTNQDGHAVLSGSATVWLDP